MSTPHQSRYKNRGKVMEELKHKKREDALKTRKENRSQLYLRRRYKFDEITITQDSESITEDNVKEWTKLLCSNNTNQRTILRNLRRAFASNTVFIDAFFSIPNALWNLVGCLSKSNFELQLEACWCITNISAIGGHKHSMKVAKSAAPYLITFLTGDNVKLQLQCSWALGNIASNGESTRAVIISQGALYPLVELLKIGDEVLLEAVSFALCNLMPSCDSMMPDLLDRGVLHSIKQHMDNNTLASSVLCELAWLTINFTCDAKTVGLCWQIGITDSIVSSIGYYIDHKIPVDECFSILTPLIRLIGNLFSVDDTFATVQHYSRLPQDLINLLDCKIDHIIKESLWVLSNLIASDKTNHEAIESFRNGLPAVVKCLQHSRDIKREAAVYICNLCSIDPLSIEVCIQCNGLHEISKWFIQLDGELIVYALKLVELILRLNTNGLNYFNDIKGKDILLRLMKNNHRLIRSMANDIHRIYYEKT